MLVHRGRIPGMATRRRDPGFYVSVPAPAGMSSRPVELLDGPWPNRAAAERRAGEIISSRGPGASLPSIVEVAADGVTILRETS